MSRSQDMAQGIWAAMNRPFSSARTDVAVAAVIFAGIQIWMLIDKWQTWPVAALFSLIIGHALYSEWQRSEVRSNSDRRSPTDR